MDEIGLVIMVIAIIVIKLISKFLPLEEGILLLIMSIVETEKLPKKRSKTIRFLLRNFIRLFLYTMYVIVVIDLGRRGDTTIIYLMEVISCIFIIHTIMTISNIYDALRYLTGQPYPTDHIVISDNESINLKIPFIIVILFVSIACCGTLHLKLMSIPAYDNFLLYLQQL